MIPAYFSETYFAPSYFPNGVAGAAGSTVLFYQGVSSVNGVTYHKGISRPTIQLADAGGGTYTVTTTGEVSGDLKADSISQETYLIDGDLP